MDVAPRIFHSVYTHPKTPRRLSDFMKEDQIMGKALFWSCISCTMVIFKSVQTEMWKKEKKEEKKSLIC